MSFQRGMNFKAPPELGIILMSRRANAPYSDELSPDESILIYEGHDVPKTSHTPIPKNVDQSRLSSRGTLTENGRFTDWVDQYKLGRVAPAVFRVYEKMIPGIWTDRGIYSLNDYTYIADGGRKVFKFRLEQDYSEIQNPSDFAETPLSLGRQIPSRVKQEVYKRDKGQCVECGAKDQLHFDHDFPYSKGGTSVLAENVRILCARHNLEKSANIQ